MIYDDFMYNGWGGRSHGNFNLRNGRVEWASADWDFDTVLYTSAVKYTNLYTRYRKVMWGFLKKVSGNTYIWRKISIYSFLSLRFYSNKFAWGFGSITVFNIPRIYLCVQSFCSTCIYMYTHSRVFYSSICIYIYIYLHIFIFIFL